MSETAGGIAALAVIALLVAAPIALVMHRRGPEEAVTTGSAHGHTGVAVHPWRGHRFTTALAFFMSLGVTALGIHYLGSSLPAAVFFIAAGLFMLYLGWCRATGRAGDGTLTLTPEGIHQLWAGSEVFVPWDDVRGLVTTRTDFIVETARPVVPIHHMPPFLSRRSVVMEAAVSLPRRGLPPLPFQEMIERYSMSSAARGELGTDEAIQRARGILAGVSQPTLTDRLGHTGTVRWVIEFVLQAIGWTMLAIGGGSLYLLATTGSAPAIDSTPLAIAVVLGSALLIWVTRRSTYKKQYRGY